MERFRKFVIFFFGVIVITLFLDKVLGKMTEKWLQPKYENKFMVAYQGERGDNIAIFGSSRASHHYVSKVIEDSLSVRVYNYGINGQNIYTQYAMLKILLNNSIYKPELILLEVSNRDVLDFPQWNTEKLKILYPYYNFDLAVKEVISLKGALYNNVVRYLTLYRYNSEIHYYIMCMFNLNTPIDEINGYEPLYKVWNKALSSDMEGNDYPIDMQKIEYLNKIIDICKENSIGIVLINSPEYAIHDDELWIRSIKEIAQNRDVKFLNYGDSHVFLSHPEWFYDTSHLNNEGAHQYTNIIIPKIREVYHQFE